MHAASTSSWYALTVSLIYLDHAATTPLAPEVLDAMLPFLRDEFGNASSTHALGVRARTAIDRARSQVAAVACGRRSEVIFTGSGTEANHLAIAGRFSSDTTRHPESNLVISAVEHPSIRENARAVAETLHVPLVEVAVDREGRLDFAALDAALTPRTLWLGVMHVQNEIGTIQPIAEIATRLRVRAPRALLHVDAIQSLGKVDLAGVVAVADSIALSAHKVHAMKGVGCLLTLGGRRLAPVLRGGGQERGFRSGTENVAGIVGFGYAVERALHGLADESRRLTELRDRVARAALACDEVTVIGGDAPRSPAILSLAVSGLRGEILQHELEARGIVIGTGSACHSGKGTVSPTYSALGLDEATSLSVLRISLSRSTTAAEIARVETELPSAIRRVRQLVH